MFVYASKYIWLKGQISLILDNGWLEHNYSMVTPHFHIIRQIDLPVLLSKTPIFETIFFYNHKSRNRLSNFSLKLTTINFGNFRFKSNSDHPVKWWFSKYSNFIAWKIRIESSFGNVCYRNCTRANYGCGSEIIFQKKFYFTMHLFPLRISLRKSVKNVFMSTKTRSKHKCYTNQSIFPIVLCTFEVKSDEFYGNMLVKIK